MSDTDALTLATTAVRAQMGMAGIFGEREAQKYARAALEAVGALAEGSQPNPVPNDGPSCHDLAVDYVRDGWPDLKYRDALMKDLVERKVFGLRKYGQPLQPFNGRDPAVDAYAEVLDLIAYLRQLAYEGSETMSPVDTGDMLDGAVWIAMRLVSGRR